MKPLMLQSVDLLDPPEIERDRPCGILVSVDNGHYSLLISGTGILPLASCLREPTILDDPFIFCVYTT